MKLEIVDNHRAKFFPLPHGWISSRMRFAIKQYQRNKNQMQNPIVLSLTKSGVKIKRDLNFGKSTEDYIGHQLVDDGQFVFASRDFDATPILCGIASDNGCISNLYIVFDISDAVNSKFLEYYFWGLKYGYQYFNKLSFGMRFSFNKTQFEYIPFIHPKFEIQRMIADFLDRDVNLIDQIVEKKQQLLELLDEKRISLVIATMAGQIHDIFENRDNICYKITEENHEINITGIFRRSRCKQHCEIVLGKMLQSKISDNNDRLLPYIRAANVRWGKIDWEDIKEMWFSPSDINKYMLKKGDLVVLEGGDVGRCAILDDIESEIGFQNSIHRVRARKNTEIRFFYYWVMYLKFYGYFDLICSKATLAHFTSEKFAETPFPLVDISIQRTIADFLDLETSQINDAIEKIRISIDRLKEYRSALITHAVTGQIDVAKWVRSDAGNRQLDAIQSETKA
ncbi:MAG: restriction endonuclease subunit S [Ectothiorhodospiraceae bacterium AqS1]|nr:restriction endonuclease subunit S [Ectothiorhodospiraceae bacterium AqS1]